MKSHLGTSELYREAPFQHFLGPSRSIVAWAMTNRQLYHLQFCDYDYGTGERYSFNDLTEATYVTTLTDTSGLGQRWSDFNPIFSTYSIRRHRTRNGK